MVRRGCRASWSRCESLWKCVQVLTGPQEFPDDPQQPNLLLSGDRWGGMERNRFWRCSLESWRPSHSMEQQAGSRRGGRRPAASQPARHTHYAEIYNTGKLSCSSLWMFTPPSVQHTVHTHSGIPAQNILRNKPTNPRTHARTHSLLGEVNEHWQAAENGMAKI